MVKSAGAEVVKISLNIFRASAWRSPKHMNTDDIAMEKDLFIGLTENRRKKERFGG